MSQAGSCPLHSINSMKYKQIAIPVVCGMLVRLLKNNMIF